MVVIINIEQSSNESKLDYHKRLVYGKLVDKTLSDLDYSELSDYVYGQHYSSDVARRMMYGSKRTLDILADEKVGKIHEDSLISELDNKLAELQKQTQITRDQAREYRKMMNSDGRWEHLRDELFESAKKLGQSVGNIFADSDSIMFSPGGDNEAILVLSDWHYGMITDNAFNKYNTEICKSRIEQIVAAAKKRIQLHGCNKIHVVFLGDAIHGAIKVGVRVASEELVVDQLLQASEILAQVVFELYKCVPSIEVHCTYGNHARVTENKADNVHRDNWERIIPCWLEQRIKAECWMLQEDLNISVAPDTGTEFLFINSCNHDIIACHGDLDSPKAATKILPRLLRDKYNLDVEYILLGDKHHRESFSEFDATAVICGSLCGTDDYANTHRLYSQPSQLLLITNYEDGVDAEYTLKCK